MSCRAVRDRLSAGGPPSPTDLRHLERCVGCAAFAERLEVAADLLRRRAEVEPDAAFAARVVGALPPGPDLFGWAAMRLLPATLALAAVLAGWCLLETPPPSDLLEQSVADDPLAWVIEYDSEASG